MGKSATDLLNASSMDSTHWLPELSSSIYLSPSSHCNSPTCNDHPYEEHDEISFVVKSNGLIQPRTMMIEFDDTGLADTAMMSSFWFRWGDERVGLGRGEPFEDGVS